ncbi:MAG: ATP-binding protein [Elusimicrobiota bacterium]|nr:ATP-binding protein [Elusimicrobiota bacterium]
MIFSKKITDITYDDCMGFIALKVRESVNLDYKEDFSSSLPKTICAFANTYGGIVIIGVKDADGFPDQTSNGIKYVDGLSERVMRIVSDNIYPPVNPETAVCIKDDKCFVVIRIAEQIDTPYTIRHNRPYVRTGDVNTPDDLATLERVEWLKNRKQKAEILREKILESINARCRNNEKLNKLDIPFGVVSMSMGPLFPYSPLFKESEMPKVRERVWTQGYGVSFPDMIESLRTVQGGASYMDYRQETGDFKYLEINHYGYIFLKKDMGIQKLGENKAIQSQELPLNRIIMFMDLFARVGEKLCKAGGYTGAVRFIIKIDKILGITTIPCTPPGYHFYGSNKTSVDSSLEWEVVFKGEDFFDKDIVFEKILEVATSISYAFGFPEQREVLKKMMAEKGPFASDKTL